MKWDTCRHAEIKRAKRKILQGWTRWFAWYPVKIGSHWVWLEEVAYRYRGSAKLTMTLIEYREAANEES